MPIAELNGQGIYFEDSGGSGRPLLLCHGFLMDGRMFDPQVEALSPEFRVIRWDARAFGRTRWDGKPFTLWDSAADCVALLDHLGLDKAVIGGMSLGGYCALRVALRHPDRVQALVLMSTRGTLDDEDTKGISMDLARIWSVHGPIEPVVWLLARPILADPDHFSPWIDRWRLLPGSHYLAATRSCVERDDIRSRLKEIRCPAIVFHGQEDNYISPADGEQLHETLPGSTAFICVPGAGHSANLTHPHLVNPPLRRFLREHA